MDLVLAYNWDETVIDIAREHGVTELFGKLHQDPVGGGRVSFILPKVGRRQAARHIRRIQEASIAFNYLLNGTCMGLDEMTSSGRRAINDLLDWAWDQGVRWFTVSIPYMAAIIKHRYPEARIVVSMMAQVDSVERAVYWENEGAEVLILFDNKDFSLLKALRSHTNLKLEVTGNLSCMNRCHQTFYHGNVASHSSNRSGMGGYSLPVCEARCTYMKVQEPRRIVAGQWIRPRDVTLYERLGVHRLKLLDRISPTTQLERIVKAYAARFYRGNLADLIPGYRQDRVDSYLSADRLATMARSFFRPLTYNVMKAVPFARRNRSPRFHIDPEALDGFLEGVMRRDCRGLACETCGWCDRYAKAAVTFGEGERERYLADAEQNLEELEGGTFFTYLRER